MNINTFNDSINAYKKLKKIASSLHTLSENDCNYGLTPRQEKRQEKLVEQAKLIAESLGLFAYHQQDPRGCALYVGDSMLNSSNYSYSTAIY